MTASGGTKRGRDEGLRIPVSSIDRNSDIQWKREERISKPISNKDLRIAKHSERGRKKRTKLTRLRENRHIQRAVAAMEEQLAAFEQIQEQPDFTSTSFSASSSFFFDSNGTQRDDSSKSDVSKNAANICTQSEEFELAALARSLRLEESSLGSERPRAFVRGHFLCLDSAFLH